MKRPARAAVHQWAQANAFAAALLALYMLVLGVTIHAHAMWADEIQAWLIARDSADISTLFHNLHYEGHPALWHLMLMPLTRLSNNPALMQALHFVIASAALAIVLWRAPLSSLERALFPFGYFTLYEYAVKSRSYALGFLLLVSLCALWRRRWHSPIAIALILALMANVHILFMIISIAAVVALVVDRFNDASPDAMRLAGARWSVPLAILIICAGWIIAVATVIPPPDLGFLPDWYWQPSLSRLKLALGALNVFVRSGHSRAGIAATLAIILIALVRFRRAPVAASFLGISVLGVLAFFYARYPGLIWHSGLVWTALFAAVWVDRVSAPAPVDGGSRAGLVPTFLFGAVLAIQALEGLAAIRNDLSQPLSSGRDAARFIAAHDWVHDPIIALDDFGAVPIVGYLGIDHAYYANGRRWGSFTIWDQRRLQPIDLQSVLTDAIQFGPTATLIVGAHTTVDPAVLRQFGFVEVVRLDRAAVPRENYTLYRRTTGG
jgi:hypothetical protein